MYKLMVLLVLGALPLYGCNQDAQSEPTATPISGQTATLGIEGMTCGSCAVTIKTAARKLDGVLAIEVDLEGAQALVTFDDQRITAQRIADRITDLGYRATVLPNEGA